MISKDEITAARKQKRRKYRLKRLGGFILALIMVVCAAVIISNLTATVFKDIKDGFRVFFTRSDDYPLTLSEGSPVSVLAVDSGYAVLTEDELNVYKNNGGLLLGTEHDYSTPALAVNGNRIVIYDKGNKKISLYNRTEKLSSEMLDGAVLSACITDSGNVAVLQQSERYASQVEVFNNDLSEKLMTWYGAKGFPLFVRNISGTDWFAAVTINSTDGKLISYLTVVDSNRGIEIGEMTVDGILLDFIKRSNGSYVVITDEACYHFGSDCSIVSCSEFGRDKLLYSAVDSSFYALVFGDNNLSALNRIEIYDINGKISGTVEGIGTVDAICSVSDSLYVSGAGKIIVYNTHAIKTDEYIGAENVFSLVYTNKIIAILNDSIILPTEIEKEK